MTSAGAVSWWIPAALAVVLALLIWVAVRAGAGTRVMPWGPPRSARAGFARRAEIRALLRPRPARQLPFEHRPAAVAPEDVPPSPGPPA